MKIIKLNKIVIPEEFVKCKPNYKKVREYCRKFIKNGGQTKPIVIDENFVLKDGYIQYLLLKENNIEDAKVRIKRVKVKNKSYKQVTTTYVSGIHPNSKCDEEYTWRLPNCMKNIHIEKGDTVYCHTKFGISPVIVTKVEVLDKPPIKGDIKKVCNVKNK